GAVGMAIEPGLTHDEFQSPAEFPGDTVDFATQLIEPHGLVAHGLADAGGRAVFTEAFAQGKTPFARRDAGLRAIDPCPHDLAVLARGGTQFIERRSDGFGVALTAPRFDPLDLLGLCLRGDREHGT